MAIEFRTDLFKVTRSDGYSEGGVSALIRKTTQALVNYGLARMGSGVYVGHPNPNLPVILYDNLPDALAFQGGRTNLRVYQVKAYGEVVPVTRVLDIQEPGWFDQAEAFWAAVKNGQPLDGFKTRAAPHGTVALFGVVHLHERVNIQR